MMRSHARPCQGGGRSRVCRQGDAGRGVAGDDSAGCSYPRRGRYFAVAFTRRGSSCILYTGGMSHDQQTRLHQVHGCPGGRLVPDGEAEAVRDSPRPIRPGPLPSRRHPAHRDQSGAPGVGVGSCHNHQVRYAARHPASHAEGRQTQRHQGTQELRLLSDLGATVQPADPAGILRSHHRLELWVRRASGHAQLPSLHHRGDDQQADARAVDQRAGGCRRRLPAAPAAGRSDVALGQSARWHAGRDGHSMDPNLLHRSGADGDPRPRRAHHR